MSTTSLERIKTESFTLEPAVDGRDLVVRFTGNGDMSAVQTLEAFLKQAEAEMVRLDLVEAVIDVRDLYFMNSSCIKAFVSWIYRAKTTTARYTIRFRANPHQHWQANTLGTLQRLAPALVRIESKEG